MHADTPHTAKMCARARTHTRADTHTHKHTHILHTWKYTHTHTHMHTYTHTLIHTLQTHTHTHTHTHTMIQTHANHIGIHCVCVVCLFISVCRKKLSYRHTHAQTLWHNHRRTNRQTKTSSPPRSYICSFCLHVWLKEIYEEQITK